MSDPKVEEIRARRAAGTRIRLVDVDHLLTKLDDAEEARVKWVDKELIPAVAREFDRAQTAEERERVLIAGVREAIDVYASGRNVHTGAHADDEMFEILSRLLTSTLTEEGKNDDVLEP